jgi:hypothetical protein
MRAVIKLKTNDNKLNKLTLEGFLQSEGFNLVDFIQDNEWLKQPDQKPLFDKIESFKSSIYLLDAKEINPIAYIYNGTTEGLLSFNSSTTFYGIRIFKHNKKELFESSEKLVESLINYFERNETKLEFSKIGIKEKEQPEDTISGEVFKDENAKIERAKLEKRLEYRVGGTLLIFGLIFILISLFSNIYYEHKLDDQNNIFEWTVHFCERITGTLLITGSVLFYNYWTFKQKLIENKSVIVWK